MRDDRLEVELRAALHREMAMARLGVTAPQIRAGIAARERSRRGARFGLLAGVAVLAIVLIIPILGGVIAPGPAAPRAGSVEPATVAALDAVSGDLVLARAWPDGRTEETARYPGAVDLLREATGGAARLPDDAATAAGPDGRLAVALRNGDVLVFRGPGRARAPVLIAGGGPGGVTWIGWTSDGRLAIVDESAIRLVDAGDGRETMHVLPSGILPYSTRLDAAELLTWTGDGRMVARRSNPSTFVSEIGSVDVAAARSTFVPGIPADVRATTGLEPRLAADGSQPTGWSPDTSPGGERVGTAAMGTGDDSLPEINWYLAARGERVFDEAWTADHRGLLVLALATADGRGRLVVADAPGSWRDGFELVGAPEGAPRLRGVAPGGRSVAVSTGTGLAVGDLATGAAATLPPGTLFVGWSSVPTVGTDVVPTLPACAEVRPATAATVALSGAGSISPASSGALPVVGQQLDDDPWHREEMPAVTPVKVLAGEQLVLALPQEACAEALQARAVLTTATDTSAPLELASRTAATANPVAGLIGIDAPPAGDWIVLVSLWFNDTSAPSYLLYRVRTGEPTVPARSPTP